MEMDIDGLIQLMEMMNVSPTNANSPEQRRQRMMLTMLKLMETRKLMESYEAQHSDGSREGNHLNMLMALKPHMTGERLHITDMLIKIFELKQIMNQISTSSCY